MIQVLYKKKTSAESRSMIQGRNYWRASAHITVHFGHPNTNVEAKPMLLFVKI